jgi:hypothetical protein
MSNYFWLINSGIWPIRPATNAPTRQPHSQGPAKTIDSTPKPMRAILPAAASAIIEINLQGCSSRWSGITTPKQIAPKRTTKAFNPVARDEVQIFRAMIAGQHMIRGFTNPDIRQILKDSSHLNGIAEPKRQSAKVTRILNRCHAHGLIAKIPRSRRWRVTREGHIAMSAAVQLREVQFPISHLKAAA